jgi:ankyrin
MGTHKIIPHSGTVHKTEIHRKRITVYLSVSVCLFLFMSACGKDMHDAVGNNELREVQALLDQNPQLLTSMKNGYTPLHYAVYKGHKEMVRLLIARGAAVDARTHDGSAKTPLHMAAETGHLAIARFLLDRGSKIDETAKGIYHQGFTPLHFAAANGHEAVVEMLIKKGANVNAFKYNTPLHAAAEQGRANTAKVLIAHGADVNNRLNIIGTPLHIAARKGHEKVAAVLIDNGADVDAVSLRRYNFRPLHFAAWHGHLEVASLLVSKGAGIDHKSLRGSPIFVAVWEKQTQMVKFLAAKGAKIAVPGHKKPLIAKIVNIIEARGIVLFLKSLHRAAAAGDFSSVETILKKYPNLINIRDEYYRTPLYHTLDNGHLEIAKLLINHGANVNIKSQYKALDLRTGSVDTLLIPKSKAVKMERCQMTPLHIAAAKGYKHILQLILTHGGKIDIKDDKKQTALEIAAQNGFNEIVEILKKHTNKTPDG